MADIARFVANTEIGQNFLVDRSVVDYMMARAKLKEGTRTGDWPGKGHPDARHSRHSMRESLCGGAGYTAQTAS
jgi:hypothetical protein